MLIETLILALLTGIILKGKITNLANLRINGMILIFGGLVLRNFHLVTRIPLFKNWAEAFESAAPWMFGASYLLLGVGILLNIKYRPMLIILAGVVMNFFAVVFNGGYMPVSLEGLELAGYDMTKIVSERLDMNHIIITANTKLVFLCDIIPVPRPYPLPQMLSIGDIVMCVGLLVFIVAGMTSKMNTKTHKVSV